MTHKNTKNLLHKATCDLLVHKQAERHKLHHTTSPLCAPSTWLCVCYKRHLGNVYAAWPQEYKIYTDNEATKSTQHLHIFYKPYNTLTLTLQLLLTTLHNTNKIKQFDYNITTCACTYLLRSQRPRQVRLKVFW